MKSTKALPIWISKLPQQYRRQRSVRRPACSPAQAARPSPNTLRYPICRPSVARATTPRRPQHRRRPEPLLQHQLRRQPRHRRRHRRKLRLRPKRLPIRLLIHRRLLTHQRLLTHRRPLMHRQNRIPRRRYRKYSRSPKRAALPNNFFSQSIHKKPALWHMPAGPVFLYFFFHLNQLVNQHFCCAVDTSIVSKGSEYDRGIFACDECCFTVVFSYAVDQDLACFGYTAADYDNFRVNNACEYCKCSSEVLGELLNDCFCCCIAFF